MGEINPNSAKRLQCLHKLLDKCREEGLLTFEKGPDPTNPMNTCILGWAKLMVRDPKALNLKIREMVERDQGGIWKKANGKYNQMLKNPTCVSVRG